MSVKSINPVAIEEVAVGALAALVLVTVVMSLITSL